MKTQNRLLCDPYTVSAIYYNLLCKKVKRIWWLKIELKYNFRIKYLNTFRLVVISGDDSRPADVTGNVVISWYVDCDIWPEPLPACQYHDATSPSYSRWQHCNYFSGLGQSLLYLDGSSEASDILSLRDERMFVYVSV